MEFVTFELAKKLKEKGFRYNKNNLLDRLCMENQINHPSISQVLKWLREKKKIYCLPHIEPIIDKWFFYVMKPNKVDEFPEYMSESEWDSYEEAVLAGIEYCLDNLI